MKYCIIIATFCSLFLLGCGAKFGPGYSAHDPDYFQGVPHIVDTATETSLVWKYGAMGFYYEPKYVVKDGALYFSLQGTTSSGSYSGTESRLPIKGDAAKAALRKGGAYWWSHASGWNNPGTTTKLQVNP